MFRNRLLIVLASALILAVASPASAAPAVHTEVKMNTDPAGSAHNEVTVVVNPTDPTNIVGGANDYRVNGGIGVYASHDSGGTWSNIILPVSSTTTSFSDPVLRFNRDGSSLYAAELAETANGTAGGCDPGSGIFFHHSSDGGTTWANGTAVATNNATVFNDKPWITDDRSTGNSGKSGNIYVSYTQFNFTTPTDCTNGASSNNSPIKLKRSTDGGNTWSSEIDVSGTYTNDQGSALVVDPSGNVYVAFNSSCPPSGGDCIVVAKSVDGGQTFTQTEVAAITFTNDLFASGTDSFRADSFPSMASDSSGNLYIVWSEIRQGTSNSEVYFSKSTNAGSSWSSPVRVNQVATHDHFFPFVVVDSSGVVWVSYSDRRDDPNNVKYRQYVSYSHDGGSSWTDLPVSSSENDPEAMKFSNNQLFIGDYNTMDVIPNAAGVWLGWCDTRNSTSSTPGQGQQDAFAGRVDANGITSSLSLNVTPSDPRVWGTTFNLSGTLTGSQGALASRTVQIQWNDPNNFQGWNDLGNPVTTDSNGNYSLNLDNQNGHFKPSKNTLVRAFFAGGSGNTQATSSSSLIRIRVGISLNVSNSSPSAGQSVSLFGFVAPGHPSKKVLIQILSNNAWKWIETIPLDSQSRYRGSVSLSGTGFRLYRAIFPTQDSDHIWNISRNIGVRWS
ncbi:MAG: sialidase family protein [Actinomycetota bacterium]